MLVKFKDLSWILKKMYTNADKLTVSESGLPDDEMLLTMSSCTPKSCEGALTGVEKPILEELK